MAIPNFRGYQLESQMYSATTRLVVLWLSKIEEDRWRQIQLTLISARLSFADVEIVQGFPTLRSCEITQEPAASGGRRLALNFAKGKMVFECEDIAYAEFSRKLRRMPAG
jgi:hypothetical protein